MAFDERHLRATDYVCFIDWHVQQGYCVSLDRNPAERLSQGPSGDPLESPNRNVVELFYIA